MSQTSTETPAGSSPVEWLDVVRRKVESLRFGSVVITVHESRVTQVESIERTRFLSDRVEPAKTRPADKSSGAS